jgi:hypothetical protein
LLCELTFCPGDADGAIEERKFVMPTKRLPAQPSLEHLKYQARDLLKGHAAGDVGVAQRLREFHPQFAGATDAAIFAVKLNLSAAQLAIAREYGFPSWPRLKAHLDSPTLAGKLELPHHERIEDVRFRRAVDLLDAGDTDGLRAWLKQNPGLVRARVVFEGGNYFRNPSLLEFVGENPIRHGKLPGNIVEIAEVILDAGPEQGSLDEALGLVATGCIPRQCGVQRALIDLLCKRGAKDLDGALQGATAHGEFEAADALLAQGARLDLAGAGVLRRTGEFQTLLRSAGDEDRQRALALAALFGRMDAVRELLDAGADPNRFNPPGAHSHSTPLHQAAVGGHVAVVRLLLERGARMDMRDLLWKGTAEDWARHEGKAEVLAFLEAWKAKSTEGSAGS